jgi:short-subunit dehydrogenase
MSKETTLITGASSGIGLHLAKQFAKHGHPLVIVAPVEAELQSIASELKSAHGVEVCVIATDLREPGSATAIHDQLGDGAVEILVNNAGHGQKGKAWEIPLEDDLSMVRLNVEAVLRLTKLFLPPMVKRGHGRIMNLSSVAGFEPGPGHAVYAATKAFLLSYSEALATELEGTGVTVTALCPGPTDTDFFPKAGMMGTRAFQQAQLMAPQDVAEAGYKAVMTGDRVIVPGMTNKGMVFLRRFLPESVQAKLQEMLTGDVPPEKQKRERGDMETKAAES